MPNDPSGYFRYWAFGITYVLFSLKHVLLDAARVSIIWKIAMLWLFLVVAFIATPVAADKVASTASPVAQPEPSPVSANAWFINLGTEGYEQNGEYICRGDLGWTLVPFDENEFPLVRAAAASGLKPPLKIFMAGYKRFNFADATIARLRTYKSWYNGFDGLPNIDQFDDFKLLAIRDELIQGILDRYAKYSPEWEKLAETELTFAACGHTPRRLTDVLLGSIMKGAAPHVCIDQASCDISITPSDYDIDRQKLWVLRFGLMNTDVLSSSRTEEFGKMICKTPEFATGEIGRSNKKHYRSTKWMAIDMPTHEAQALISGGGGKYRTYLTVKNWRIVNIQFVLENEGYRVVHRSEDWKKPSIPKRYSNDNVFESCW